MSEVDAERSDCDLERPASTNFKPDSQGLHDSTASSIQDEVVIRINEDQKLGVTGAVFLILNKMIGTGSTLFYSPRLFSNLTESLSPVFSTPSGIFAATGSVGVSLFLWVIGEVQLCYRLPAS